MATDLNRFIASYNNRQYIFMDFTFSIKTDWVNLTEKIKWVARKWNMKHFKLYMEHCHVEWIYTELLDGSLRQDET